METMYELTGKFISGGFLNFDPWGNPIVSIRLNEKQNAFQMFDELKDAEKITIKVSKFKEKRTKDANAFAWVLIDKIAAKTGVTKTEVYRQAIKEIGGNSDIVCIKNEAVKSLCEGWKHNGLGWQTDTLPSKIDGCTNVVLYYGSSTYTVDQMKLLLNLLVQDCEQLGIDTKPKEEIESLLNSWREK